MTTSFLMLLAAAFPGAGPADGQSPFDHALETESAWVYRAQSPEPYPSSGGAPLAAPPGGVQSYYQPGYQPGYSDPMNPGMGTYSDPFSNQFAPMNQAPMMQDPWTGNGLGAPFAVPAPNQGFYTYGLNGPQPRRFGWQARYDFTYIPTSGTSNPDTGNFETLGADFEKELTFPIGHNWVGAIAPQFGYRSYEGPNGTATTDLPGSAYRFGLGLTLQTPTVGGWTWEFNFTPFIGTDLRSSLSSDAFMFDAHGVAFLQMNRQWLLALGVVYRDRVDKIILPYAGVVWTPNDIWEFRLVFPNPRISVFLGMPFGVPTWLYATGEYHVEAYQMSPKLLASETRVQFKDFRALGGLRWETGNFTTFAEAGYVFDRDVEYDTSGIPGFDVDGGFIGRVGLRY